MKDEKPIQSPRIKLLRDVAVLQVKLLVDGMRDALLIPVSLVAGIVGILRGGEEPDTEFRRVIELGLRSERWINLFGQQPPPDSQHPARSFDEVIEQAEAVVVGQLKKGRPARDDQETGKDQPEEK